MPAKKKAEGTATSKKATKKPSKKTVKKTAKRKVASRQNKAGVTSAQKGILESTLEGKARRITEKDIEELIKKEQEMDEKLRRLPEKLRKLLHQVRLLYSMIKDYTKGRYREVPWYTVAMAAAAVLYFLSPIDLIPDWIPVAGYLDDLTVMALCYRAIAGDLKKYCAHIGCEEGLYF